MAKYFYGHTDEQGIALCQWPTIHYEAAKFAHFTIIVFDEDEAITHRQRRWFKGVCCKGLSQWNGDTLEEWSDRLKGECGGEIFKLNKYETAGEKRYRFESITVKSKNQMTDFIENILSRAITMDWPVYPPDPSLRKQ